ncbi:MAG: ornithine cyclodeaminase family protein [Bryobacteraceae bacterium]
MTLPYFTEADVRRLLPMTDAIAAMRRVFVELAAGRAQNQPRRRLVLPTGSVLHSLAGAVGDYFGTKFYSTHRLHGAHFFFMLYAAADARPLALMEANYLGQIRTGAASGFATDLLASESASTLAVIGTGFQARSQLEAVLAVRPIRAVRVWSRDAERRAEFARECSESFGIKVEAVATAEEAVRGADVIATATSAKDPVLESNWVAPHAHVNGIGSNQPKRRELPPELIRRASLIAVDSIEQARLEAGDLILALDEDGWRDPKLVELQTISGDADRRAHSEPTVFKSLGLGVEEVAVAALVYENGRKEGLGG